MSQLTAEQRRLRTAHDAFLADGTTTPSVRPIVAESWLRSAAAGVNADGVRPEPLDQAELEELRAAHPLAPVFPLLDDILGQASEACDSLMAVSDAEGRLLWVAGSPEVVRKAERIAFVPGAMWDEAHAGTNAPGTALRLDRAVQIHAAEHFLRPVHQWSCAAAPIHDPFTRSILGIVDVTGGDGVGAPQTFAMVRAAARMAESELARLQLTGQAAMFTTPGVVERTRLSGLGRNDCLLHDGSRTLRLSPRHSEILVLLADHRDGLSGDELAVLLSDSMIMASSLRAELTRLRSILGPQLLQSRPYRLSSEVETDWSSVSALLAAGRLNEAVAAYGGPLLPQSEAPGIVDRRESLAGSIRAAILASGRPELMVGWTRSRWGATDLPMWQAQAAALPVNSPLRPLAGAEVKRLDAELRAQDGSYRH